MFKKYLKSRKLSENLNNALKLRSYYEDEVTIYRHNYSKFSIYLMIGELVKIDDTIDYIREELYK